MVAHGETTKFVAETATSQNPRIPIPMKLPVSKNARKSLFTRVAIAALFFTAVHTGLHPAIAASFTWGSGAVGGTGTWDDSTVNWNTGGADTAWVSGTDAVFAGTAGTVTITPTGVSAHNLTFNVTGYTITGGTLTLVGNTPTITTAASVNATVTSVISGTAGLKLGNGSSGSITIGAGNTYTGTTLVQNGSVNISDLENSGTASSFGLSGTVQLG